MKSSRHFLYFFSTLLVFSCQQKLDSTPPANADKNEKVKSGGALSILDTENLEVPLAKILIGAKIGEPFQNNFLTADLHGQLKIPSEWTSDQSVSVIAEGFVPVSFLHTSPGAHVFKLRKKSVKNNLEYSGSTAGYPPFDDRSIGHVSLVFEAFRRANFWDFSLAQLLSPEADHLSVVGNDVAVPSNLAIPNQTVAYIISINISKPVFRIPLEPEANHLMVGLQAHFPVTDLIRGVRAKKSVFDMINIFEFASFTAEDLRIDKLAVNRDINISQNPIALKAALQAPKFDPSLVMIAMSTYEKNQNLIALDIKTIASGESMKLNTLSENHQSEKNLSILKIKATAETAIGAAQEFMSLAIHDAGMRVLPQQFEILPAPKVSPNQIEQELPAQPSSVITASGMYFALSDVNSSSNSGVSIETKNPSWEVYNPIWERQSILPTLPKVLTTPFQDSAANFASSQRWSVAVLGSDQKASSDLGPDRLKDVNYIGRTAVDLH